MAGEVVTPREPAPEAEALKACPWCGKVPDITDDKGFVSTDGEKWGALACCGTGPEIRTGYRPVSEWKAAAIAAWNDRRASETSGEAT